MIKCVPAESYVQCAFFGDEALKYRDEGFGCENNYSLVYTKLRNQGFRQLLILLAEEQRQGAIVDRPVVRVSAAIVSYPILRPLLLQEVRSPRTAGV